MTKYNDTFTMILCSAARLKTSYDELLAVVMHLGCFSCHATLYCTLLCFAAIESPVLQPLTTHDIAFSCLLGARY